MSAPATMLATTLAAGRKASQLYPRSHPAFSEAMDALMGAIEEATAAGPFQINLHQGRLYHADTPVPEDAPGVKVMEEAFESRRIESLTLHPGFTKEEVVALVEVLTLRPSLSLDVEKELSDRSVTHVTVAFLAEEDREEREERERLREQDRAAYNRLVGLLREVSAKVAGQDTPDISSACDVVGSILRRLMDDRAAIMGLATIKGQTDSGLFHSINVMIHSMVLGSALGLPEEGLASLGVSALLHDIGKAAFDHSDPSQAEPMRLLHPTVGADILSRLPGEDKAPMLVAYEHHMNVDGSGYPEHPADYIAHPYSRMVSIADRYTNLVDLGSGKEPLTRDQAVMRLLADVGTMLDPLFTRLFIKAIGVFPVGCMVRLSDHSVGVVSAPGDDPLTPTVRMIYDPDGMAVEGFQELDLTSTELKIVEVVDPESLAVEVSEHL